MLKNRKMQFIAVLGVLGLVAAAALAYSFLRPPEETSEPISSIPIDDAADPTSEAAEPNEDSGDDEDSSQMGGVVLFEIVPAESVVRFTLGEVLRGQANTVVGSTDQVAGEISIDLGNPAASQVGTILVNARTFTTDSVNRDRAIKNQILDTNDYEFLTFVPTSVSGWPQEAVVGYTFELEIVGDLTIKDVTLEVTFLMTLVAVSETRLEGVGFTTIKRGDYNLTIPDVPAVASVDEEVLLEIEFVAVAVD